jgi:antiviral helicase SLH1
MQIGGIRIFAPRYPKPQSEGFFVVISYSSTDEIVALKRVGWNDPSRGGGGRGGRAGHGGNARLHASARISLPPEAQGKTLDVSVLSDSYLGMKWKIESIEVPEAPRVEDGGKKEKVAV